MELEGLEGWDWEEEEDDVCNGVYAQEGDVDCFWVFAVTGFGVVPISFCRCALESA